MSVFAVCQFVIHVVAWRVRKAALVPELEFVQPAIEDGLLKTIPLNHTLILADNLLGEDHLPANTDGGLEEARFRPRPGDGWDEDVGVDHDVGATTPPGCLLQRFLSTP